MSLPSLYADFLFRLSSLTWLGLFDILLVALAFYLLLVLVQRSRAAFLLRGTLALGVVLIIVTVLLPLPTFDWLVRGALIALLVATPVIFQPELRRLLERVGRSAGLTQTVRRSATENLMPRLMRAVENLSGNCTGALIVLEGNGSIEEEIATGVHIGGQVTSELLQAIFHPETPLHDGAIIVRDDQVVTAGCVLPLTQQPLESDRRLGTRHRAAVGLSETCDALVVVVSEETGEISVARAGQLRRPLVSAALRQQLIHFFTPSSPARSDRSLRRVVNRFDGQSRRWPVFIGLRSFVSKTILLAVALVLATAAWTFVNEQTNPTRRIRIEDVPLRVENLPNGTAIVTPLPATVSVLVQTTANVQDTLRQSSFQAGVLLQELSPGLYHLPVQVSSGATFVRVLAVEPAALDAELAPVISRTLAVTVDLPKQQRLSPAYTIVNAPEAWPGQVDVVGPAPLVDRVSRVQATVPLANGYTSLREYSPLQALDEAGRAVTGVTLQPAQVRVSVSIYQRFNARDVGIRVVTSGTPAAGYWVSGLTVTPAGVTVEGNPESLSQIGSYVDTLPVDVSQAAGNLSMHIPLDLPPDLQVLDSDGNPVQNVRVHAQITPRQGDLTLTRPVELLNVSQGMTATVNPPEVDLLLSGPLPALSQVEENESLVRVLVEAVGLADQGTELIPTIIVPSGIQVQMIPRSVLVTLP